MTPAPAAVTPPARAPAPPGRARATDQGDEAQFATALDQAQARTAETEGLTTTTEPVADTSGQARAGSQATADAAVAPEEIPVLPVVVAPAPVVVGGEVAAAPAEGADDDPTAPNGGEGPDAAIPAAPAQDEAQVVPVAPAAPAQPSAAAAAAAAALGAQATDAAVRASVTAVADAAAVPSTPVPVTASPQAATGEDAGSPTPDQGPAPGASAAQVRERRAGDVPRAESATPAPAAGTPAAPATAAQPVTLHQPGVASAHVRRTAVLEGAQGLLELAVRHGMNRARLTLRPEELGGLEVRLHSTSAGLSASVRADTEATAASLQTALTELRRSLEQAGVTVARLDVSWTGHGPHDGRRNRSSDASPDGNGRRGGDGFDLDALADAEAIPVTTAPAPRADAGALLDVEA